MEEASEATVTVRFVPSESLAAQRPDLIVPPTQVRSFSLQSLLLLHTILLFYFTLSKSDVERSPLPLHFSSLRTTCYGGNATPQNQPHIFPLGILSYRMNRPICLGFQFFKNIICFLSCCYPPQVNVPESLARYGLSTVVNHILGKTALCVPCLCSAHSLIFFPKMIVGQF